MNALLAEKGYWPPMALTRRFHRILVVFLIVSLLGSSVVPAQPVTRVQAAPDPGVGQRVPDQVAPALQAATIQITLSGFNPAQVTIQVGEQVTWNNTTGVVITLRGGQPGPDCGDSASQTYLPLIPKEGFGVSSADTVEGDSGAAPLNDFVQQIAAGGSFSLAYDTAGTFFFYRESDCATVGTITVGNAPTPVPPTVTPTPTATPSPTPTATPIGLLGAIGDQTAELGSTLTIQLRSDRPNAIFDMEPLPLPENASFDVVAGVFRYHPSLEQIGTVNLTFSATAGQDRAAEAIRITVPQPDPNGVTALRGRILDANEAAKGIEKPLVGATVRHMDSGQSVTTNADGVFTITGLAAGEHYFEYDGSTAAPAGTYGAYRSQKVLIANVTNVIDRPIYIMAIDTAGQAQVDPATETVVNNPNLDTTLTIPAHTVMDDGGNEYAGPISVSEVPADFTPGSLPDTLDPGLVLTIQPMGLTFNQPAPISFPNFDNLPPGSIVDLWSMDHETSRFFIAGQGRVTSDGAMIETIDGGIRESSWHFPMPPLGDPEKTPDGSEESDTNDDCQNFSSSIGTADGCLLVSAMLPAYTSLGTAQDLTFVYSSKRAYPQTLLPFQAVLPNRAAVPPQMSYTLNNFGGISDSRRIYLDTSSFSENLDESLRGVIAVDSTDLQTGVQPYQIRLTSHYRSSDVSGDIAGRTIVVNEQNSAFGAGWGLAGLSQLHESYGGRLLLTNGNGTAQLFGPQPLDLTAWTQEGVAANGRWTVADDGQSVFQAINQDPTFFVSPDDFLNTTIRGTFLVEHNGSGDTEGDFIGFVFGYQSPFTDRGDDPNDFDFLLFSWKGADQVFNGSPARAGYSLARVKGNISDYFPSFWVQEESPEFQILASDYASDKGWSRNVEYDFELDYSATHIRIRINGQPIFDLAGDFKAGRFGFYNYSQQEVRYKNFSSSSETARFVGPVGDFSTITKGNDGSYVHRFKDGTEYRFNAAGFQTDRLDRNNNLTHYEYDGENRLTRITDPAGLANVLEYSGNHLTRVTDPSGRSTDFAHDANGNLIRITYPDSTTQQFNYDSRHLIILEMDQRGETRRREYDAWGRLVTANLPEAVVRQASYSQSAGLVDLASGEGSETNPAPVTRPEDAVGRIVDGEGRATSFIPGALGRPVRITDAAGFATAITRDSDGNPLRTVLPSGAILEGIYDNRGNLLSFTDRTVNGTTQFTYDRTFNQVTSVTDPFRQVSTFNYDGEGNLTLATTPLGRNIHLRYGPFGLPSVMTDTLGTETRVTYNATGNPTQIASGAGADERVMAMTHTSEGYVNSLTDPLGRSFGFTYDAFGRVTQETLPGNRSITYAYDGEGNLTQITPPGRPAHGFEYDGLGQVTAYIPPAVTGSGNTRTAYVYNKAQQLTQVTRPDDKQMTYSYDNGGRLTTQTQPRGDVTFSYHAGTGLLNGIAASEGVNLAYTYQGELLTGIALSGPVAGSVNFTYDRNYRITQDAVNGQAITYAYDADDALTRAGNLTLAYAQDSGLLTSTTLGSVSDQWQYNAFGELTNYTASYNATAPFLYGTSYTRDKLGRITQKTETLAGVTTTFGYTYDAASRLSQVQQNGTTIATYTYDANGNRLTGPGGATGTYDDQDRLLSYGGATYTYTANGELLTRTQNGQTATYDYDLMGNLMGVTLPDNTRIAYLVDGQDRRVGKKINGTLVQGFLYQDQLNPIAELDGSGSVVNRFVYGIRGHVPDYMIRSGVTYRIISDHLGSVRFVVNAQTGEIAQRIDYDAWGNILQDTNPGFQPFGFAGGLYDVDTQLVRFGARDYDTEAGRWTTKDSIGFESGDANLYIYVESNPVTFIDPSGKVKIKGVTDEPIFVHPNDADPFPSNPHGHIGSPNSRTKLDINTGEIYDGTRPTGTKIPANKLKKLRKILKAGKIIPVVGTVIALASFPSTVEAKGLGPALADAGLDAIPIIGEVKALGELLFDDLIPDRQCY